MAGLVVAAATAVVLAANYEGWFVMPKLREPVLALLHDPDTAKFRGERMSLGKDAVCGEFNAKNLQGGYVGYRRFIATGTAAVMEGSVPTRWITNADDAPQFVRQHVERINQASRDRVIAGGAAITLDTKTALLESAIFDETWATLCASGSAK